MAGALRSRADSHSPRRVLDRSSHDSRTTAKAQLWPGLRCQVSTGTPPHSAPKQAPRFLPRTGTIPPVSVASHFLSVALSAPERSSTWGVTVPGGGGKGVEDRYPLSLLGSGRPVDGLPAQHCIERQNATVLLAGPSSIQRNHYPQRQRHVGCRRTSSRGESDRRDHLAIRAAFPASVSALQGKRLGDYSLAFSSRLRGGTHQLRLSSAESASHLDAEIPVQSTPLEQRGRPARHDVLKEIAQLTRGQFLLTSEAAKVITALDSLPEPGPEIRRVPLWAHPAWAATLLLLLSTFWILRKRLGMF